VKFTGKNEYCTVSVETNTEHIDDILVVIKQFLQAYGYVIDGQIVIVEDDYQELKDKLSRHR